jgi:hypothetical protein
MMSCPYTLNEGDETCSVVPAHSMKVMKLAQLSLHTQ